MKNTNKIQSPSGHPGVYERTFADALGESIANRLLKVVARKIPLPDKKNLN